MQTVSFNVSIDGPCIFQGYDGSLYLPPEVMPVTSEHWYPPLLCSVAVAFRGVLGTGWKYPK